MKDSYSQPRRTFLKIAATTGAGFAIGIQLNACSDKSGQKERRASKKVFSPNIWIEILEDNRIVCFFAEAEMGQAVATSLPLILAEELGADWNLIDVRHAPITTPYGGQSTADSRSIRENWQPLRKAGAMARQMLIDAAKLHFDAPSDTFDTENSWIINQQSGEKVKFGAVVSIAQKLPLPLAARLRSPETYKLIGHSPMPKFSREKLTGELIYASDIHIPNMAYATMVHPPVFDSTYQGHDDTEAKKLPGYIGAFPIKEGLAVIANDTWTAFQASRAIKITWSDSIWENLTSNGIYTQMEEAGKQPGQILYEKGLNPQKSNAPLNTILKRVYTTPFQAHATMEPMCCVAYIHDGTCEVWAPTQSPTNARSIARTIHYNILQRITSKIKRTVSPESDHDQNVILHPQFLGGGFGRRLKNDYVSECVQIASRINRPVKLQWTREEDIRHDFYRATSRHIMHAILDHKTKRITHWEHKIVSPSISTARIPYNIPSQVIKAIAIKTAAPLGSWRSVDNSNNIYAIECFIDEIADQLSIDPVQFRISLLDAEPRLKHVLIEAERKSIQTKARNTALGCAVFKGYGSFIALITEMGLRNNVPKIIRITAVVDCGMVIDPNQAKAQLEGGLIYALTAATRSEITINNGSIVQDNFDNFPLLRISETPELNISFVDSINSPGGLGEVPVPPLSPSVHNAARALKVLNNH